MTNELARMDTVAHAELVQAGAVTPTELVDAAIERIEALNPQLNAVIHKLYDKARAEASSPHLADGPFRGIPMLLKDLWPHSAGDPWHQGVRGLKDAGYVHPVDSDLVRRYREAGFVILGRTNTPELGLSATTEPEAYGPTRNPWNIDHGAGGSSGGAAAAVASGMVPAANASDGGGSIRIPAALCGLVGLKPSRGRVPMGPGQDEWTTSVQHVVSHTVRDAAAILDISARPTLGDGVVAPDHGRPWATTHAHDPGRLRIGFLAASPRPTVELDPEIAAATRATAELLGRLGHDVEEAHPAAIDEQADGGGFGSVGPSSALQIERMSAQIGRPFTAADVEAGTWKMAQSAPSVSGLDVVRAQHEAHVFRRRMAEWWASGFDLLLTPTCGRTAPVIGDLAATPDDPLRPLTGSIPYAMYTSMFNVTGQPGISLPLAQNAAGLPIGMQLIGAYGREDQLLQVARQLEAEVRWAEHRAPMHP